MQQASTDKMSSTKLLVLSWTLGRTSTRQITYAVCFVFEMSSLDLTMSLLLVSPVVEQCGISPLFAIVAAANDSSIEAIIELLVARGADLGATNEVSQRLPVRLGHKIVTSP